MSVNISDLIEQINKVENYVWDRVQSDYILNNHGSFLFKTYDYIELLDKIRIKIKEKNLPNVFEQYTINRWYNFACSIVIQSFLEEHKRVTAEPNRRSLVRDIFIDKNPFDFKITYVFKNCSKKMLEENLKNPTNFIIKYYKGGGKQRMHMDPKLFMIFCDQENHNIHQWEMKREFPVIKDFLQKYLDGTGESEYLNKMKYKISDSEHVIEMADLFFIVKNDKRRSGVFFNWKGNVPEKTVVELTSL